MASIREPSHQASRNRPASRTRRLDSTPSPATPRIVASQILSRAAEDLRTPLSSLRASVRAVADGMLGDVNFRQSQFLDQAMQMCETVDRLVGNFSRMRPQSPGPIAVRREWTTLQSVRKHFEQSFVKTARSHVPAIFWHGFDQPVSPIFADASITAKLIEQLVDQLIAHANRRVSVLIRATIAADQQSIIVSVTTSFEASPMHRWFDPLEVSGNGDDVCAASLCRQFAAAHFSALTVMNRRGAGLEIQFEVPTGGAANVAAQWSQWRSRYPVRIAPRRAAQGADVFVGAHQAFDDGDWQLRVCDYEGTSPLQMDSASVLTVVAGAAVEHALVEFFDRCLQNNQGPFDLVFRVSPRRWAMIWDTPSGGLAARIEAVVASVRAIPGALRLTWSDPRSLATGTRQTAVAIVDTVTRLAFDDREPVGVYDDDMSTDGSNHFAMSAIAEGRLQIELLSLAKRFAMRSERLQDQGTATRWKNDQPREN